MNENNPTVDARAELEELRLVNADLQHEFEQFRLHLPEAFVEVDLSLLRVLYINQLARTLLGYSEEDVAGDISAPTLVAPESLSELLEAGREHLARSVWAGQPYRRARGQRVYPVTMVRRDGSRFPADVLASYVLSEGGVPTGVRFMFRDTTERMATEAERSRLAALVESSDDAIVSRTVDDIILSWNRGAERLYGWSAAEAIGRHISFIEPEAVRGEMKALLAHQPAGERRTIETKRLTRDGDVIDVSLSLFPVSDASGQVVAIGGIGRDLGDKIRAAEAISRSNEMLKVIATAQDAHIRGRPVGDVFSGLLDGLLRLTGSEHGLIGELEQGPRGAFLRAHAISAAPLTEAGVPAGNGETTVEIHDLENLFGRVLLTGETIIANDLDTGPSRVAMPAGYPPCAHFMAVPIHVGDHLLGMVGVANRPGGYTADIAEGLEPFLTTCGALIEAIHARAARRAAEARLDLAMQGADLALWEWDVPENAMHAHFADGGRHGYTIDSNAADLDWLIGRVHPDDRQRVVRTFSGHASGRSPAIECEYRITDGYGEERWMLARGMVVQRDAAGLPLRAAGTFLDITERHRAEAERNRLELQMRQNQKFESLGVFAGGIAHDFNNLLTAVLGNLYMLRPSLQSPDDLELAGEATRAAERGAELVRRLLTYARPEVEAAESISLDALLDETLLIARSGLTPSIQIEVRHSGHDHARGSWTSLQQIILNLLINARDAMPGGGTLTISRRVVQVGPRHSWAPPELPRGRYHVITIADTGTGIPPDVLERIFDPFFTTKDVSRGSGLGLPTALGIARAHGGWLAVETTPGKGTEFRLLLPVAEDLA